MPDSNWQKLILVEGLETTIVDNILLWLFFIRQNVSFNEFLSSEVFIKL